MLREQERFQDLITIGIATSNNILNKLDHLSYYLFSTFCSVNLVLIINVVV